MSRTGSEDFDHRRFKITDTDMDPISAGSKSGTEGEFEPAVICRYEVVVETRMQNQCGLIIIISSNLNPNVN